MTQVIPLRVLSRPPRQEGRFPLLCLTYAGGGTRSYESWHRLLPDFVEALTLRLPGRETRIAEPPPSDLRVLAGQIAAELETHLTGRFAVFGHSVGALLAYELARALRTSSSIEPSCLFVSGMPAPDRFNDMQKDVVLNDTELRERMAESTDPAILDDPDLWDLFAPIIRSDLTMGNHYRYVPAQPLSCPIVAYGATHDPGLDAASLSAWSAHTTGPFQSRTLPGDHFYFRRWPEILAADLTRRLDQYLGEGYR